MITIVAKSTIKEGKVEKYMELVEKLIIESRKEEGCIKYDLYSDINNPNILTFIEEWKDQDAIDFHNSTPHFTEIVPKLKELGEGDSQVNLYKKLT